MFNPEKMLARCKAGDPGRPLKYWLPFVGRVWVVHNPRYADAVLDENADSFGKGGKLWDRVSDLLGKQSLITVESPPADARKGSEWATLRAEAMRVLDRLTDDMIRAEVERVCAQIRSDGKTRVDLKELALCFTGQCMLAASDLDADHQLVLRLADKGLGMLVDQMLRSFLPFGRYLPASRRFRAVCDLLTKYCGPKRDLIVTLLVAGRDTTASAIVSVLRASPDKDIDDAVAENPPIYWFPRRCVRPAMLSADPRDTAQPGDTVILFPYAFARMHGCYDMAYGEGIRRCAGRRAAQRMIRLFVEGMRQNFQIKPIGKNELDGGITLWHKNTEAWVF